MFATRLSRCNATAALRAEAAGVRRSMIPSFCVKNKHLAKKICYLPCLTYENNKNILQTFILNQNVVSIRQIESTATPTEFFFVFTHTTDLNTFCLHQKM